VRWQEPLVGYNHFFAKGRVSMMSKAQAQSELAARVQPINNRISVPSEERSFGEFAERVFLPFYRRNGNARPQGRTKIGLPAT